MKYRNNITLSLYLNAEMLGIFYSKKKMRAEHINFQPSFWNRKIPYLILLHTCFYKIFLVDVSWNKWKKLNFIIFFLLFIYFVSWYIYINGWKILSEKISCPWLFYSKKARMFAVLQKKLYITFNIIRKHTI